MGRKIEMVRDRDFANFLSGFERGSND